MVNLHFLLSITMETPCPHKDLSELHYVDTLRYKNYIIIPILSLFNDKIPVKHHPSPEAAQQQRPESP